MGCKLGPGVDPDLYLDTVQEQKLDWDSPLCKHTERNQNPSKSFLYWWSGQQNPSHNKVVIPDRPNLLREASVCGLLHKSFIIASIDCGLKPHPSETQALKAAPVRYDESLMFTQSISIREKMQASLKISTRQTTTPKLLLQ